MKKALIKIVAVALIMAMTTVMFTGCKKSTGSLYTPPEFIFVAQSVPLDSNNYIGALVYGNEKLFYTYNEEVRNDDNPFFYASYPLIFTMELDGTRVAELPNYKTTATIPPGASGGIYINGMQTDADGNLWIVESWDFYKYNLPDDFDSNNDAPWNYDVDYENGSIIRKLDKTGAELLTLDISDLQSQQEYFYVQSFGVDAAGNVYISANNSDKGGQSIYVFDKNGNGSFSIDAEGWLDSFIRISDGSVAVTTDSTDEDGNYIRILQKIDFNAKSFGETYPLPQRAYQIMPGVGEFDLIYLDGSSLFAVTLGNEEPEKLLNWLDSDILEGSIRNIIMLSDEKIICTNQTWDNMTGETSNELITLIKTPYSELPQKKILTLATYYSWSIRDSVVMFNRTNPDYRIQVIDYSQYSTQDDWNAGLTRLSTELISGVVPDILDVSNLPYKEYVAKGLLADLYKFIDSDPDLGRDALLESAFSAAEIDGKLYQVFSSFYIRTIIGHPSKLGSEMGWNMDEFKAVLDAHPEADMPLGQWLTKTSFLQAAVSYNIDEYIDWSRGRVNFDNDDFIGLLEFANTFPSEEYYYGDDMILRDGPVALPGGPGGEAISQEEAIATGRQIMLQSTIFDYWDYLWNKSQFGGEIVFKGFPTENRNGTSLVTNTGLAIMEKSPNKDAAWSFVRTFLEKDTQMSGYFGGMLTNKAAFNQRAAEAMEQEYDFPQFVPTSDGGFSYDDSRQARFSLTQADVDQILAVIDSASGTSGWNVDESIWNIISEEVAGFFAGTGTAQDAARIIQSRLSILVSERS